MVWGSTPSGYEAIFYSSLVSRRPQLKAEDLQENLCLGIKCTHTVLHIISVENQSIRCGYSDCQLLVYKMMCKRNFVKFNVQNWVCYQSSFLWSSRCLNLSASVLRGNNICWMLASLRIRCLESSNYGTDVCNVATFILYIHIHQVRRAEKGVDKWWEKA